MPNKDPEKKRATDRAYHARHRARRNASNLAYSQAHRAELNAKARAYRAANTAASAARNRAYYLAHKDTLNAQMRAYRAANKARISAQRRAKYAANREREIARAQAYREANRILVRIRIRAYAAAHPALLRELNARRRARKKAALLNNLTAAQWREIQAAYGFRCVYCHQKPSRLTMDHLTPLSAGGSHTVANIVPACITCNARKNAGPPLAPVQPLLLTVAPART